ncbi:MULTISPECIES: orotate phosphoribosyltransferase [Candidatus Ichthyocystis]|uniref:Orotate phosphoribosyltransferase n=1 Tax=Candidatus Ichthyocystis hellenicum TaxID=1561003 RepID=A0A0S4M0C3_9BURK|nr:MULTISPECIES: orotate phosphoribosyltransferase [Ichthyocystis]CUT17267.1 putative orotate phosphoribosyltransferase [Candidatus Ichthyocystis hellenicum]
MFVEHARGKINQIRKNFIEFCQKNEALLFGEFITKAERRSPYFFNFGQFSSGASVETLGMYYAQRILLMDKKPDVIFGSAYKGIPLSVSAAIALHRLGLAVEFCYNRKEIKDHGEQGRLIGGCMNNKQVLIVDDVLSSGISVIEANQLITEAGGHVIGAVVAIDREEVGNNSNKLARDELMEKHDIYIDSLISLSDIIDLAKTSPSLHKHLESLIRYQKENGIPPEHPTET